MGFKPGHYLKRVCAGPRAGISIVLPVFLLLCIQANAASPDTSADSAYVRLGGGLFFLDMSESGPFIRANGKEEVVGFLNHYDAEYEYGVTGARMDFTRRPMLKAQDDG